jgi:poly-gamma-glutamate capsule biosynthesis protein CapA/YwtB (metallophosphatase superfamily)
MRWFPSGNSVFHAVTHANNHAFDLGPPGIASTRAAVEAAGLKLAGSGLGYRAGRRAGHRAGT